jgi:Tol biopolymer transport system component
VRVRQGRVRGLLTFGSSDSTDDASDIFTVAPNGTRQRNLTQSPGVFDLEPVWSPDGTKIAFASTRDDYDYEIYVMNWDGSNPMRLTRASTARTGRRTAR